LDAVPEDLVGVTLEPEGGSAEPTLPMIAEGTL
jgi:anti-sigma-K factor RskA